MANERFHSHESNSSPARSKWTEIHFSALVQIQEFHSLTAMMAHALVAASGPWYSQTFALGKLENIYS